MVEFLNLNLVFGIIMAPRAGLEPALSGSKPLVLPLDDLGIYFNLMAPPTRFELVIAG